MYTLKLYPGLLPVSPMPEEAIMPKPASEFDKLAKEIQNVDTCLHILSQGKIKFNEKYSWQDLRTLPEGPEKNAVLFEMALRGLVFGFFYLEVTAGYNPVDPVTNVSMVYFAALSQSTSLLNYIDKIIIPLEKIPPITQWSVDRINFSMVVIICWL